MQARKPFWHSLAWPLAFMVLGFALIKAGRGHFGGWLFLSIGTCYALAYPLIFLHELGHVLAGMAVGFDVVKIVVGIGHPLWSGKILGLSTTFNAVPYMGFTFGGTADLRWRRLRRIIFTLGGPLTNAALALLAISVSHTLHRGTSPYLTTVVYGFIGMNIVMLVGNLVPYRIAGPYGGVVQTDGASVLSAIFGKAATLDTWREGYYLVKVLQAREARDRDAIRQWGTRGLEVFPGSWSIRNMFAVAELDVGDFAAAHRTFLDLLSNPDVPELGKVVLKNNAAFAAAQTDDPALVAVADALSREALGALPWQASFKSTRGAVLIALSRSEEAIPLLEQSLDDEMEPRNRATIEASLALAHFRVGEKTKSQDHLARALLLDKDGPVVRRVQGILR